MIKSFLFKILSLFRTFPFRKYLWHVFVDQTIAQGITTLAMLHYRQFCFICRIKLSLNHFISIQSQSNNTKTILVFFSSPRLFSSSSLFFQNRDKQLNVFIIKCALLLRYNLFKFRNQISFFLSLFWRATIFVWVCRGIHLFWFFNVVQHRIVTS